MEASDLFVVVIFKRNFICFCLHFRLLSPVLNFKDGWKITLKNRYSKFPALAMVFNDCFAYWQFPLPSPSVCFQEVFLTLFCTCETSAPQQLVAIKVNRYTISLKSWSYLASITSSPWRCKGFN